MSGSFLLDTNIVIALFAGEQSVVDHVADADEVFLSCIVLGELLYGARKSGRPAQNRQRIDQFAKHITLLECNSDTASEYSEIKAILKQLGRPLPENDIWIAAVARQYNLTLATRDAHFQVIKGLQCDNW